VGGCFASHRELRQESAVRQSFISTKPAEALAGCIAEGWAADSGIPAITNRTEKGWIVIHQTEPVIFGAADVLPEGVKTTVIFFTNYPAQTKRHVDPIVACL
jgi:hypothetical protein